MKITKIMKPKPSTPKKPLVNWFSREKEVEYSTKKRGDYERNVSTKVVKAPESVLSKGFEKKVVKEHTVRPSTKQTKERRAKIGAGVAGGGALVSLGGMALNNYVREKKEVKNVKKLNSTIDHYNNNFTGAHSIDEMNKIQKDRDRDVSAAKNKINSDNKRSANALKGFAAAFPLSIGAGIAIGSKGKDRDSKRTVTKTKTPRKK